MGIFDLFGKKDLGHDIDNGPNVTWKILTSITQLEALEEISNIKPVVIFKHSTRCGISSLVLRKFENEYKVPLEKMEAYYLDLLSYRNVSNEIANRFRVIHQSPQILVLHKGEVVHHASHHTIDAEDLLDFID